MPEPRTLKEEILEGLPLNERELEILELACAGHSAEVTGKRIYLAAETVKSYRKSAIAKLAARNITHACVLAVGNGYVNIAAILDEHEEQHPS